MPYDVPISAGVVTDAIKSGFAEIRNEAVKTRNDIAHELGRAITFGGLATGFEQVIEKAHEIHHQAERFGVDAQFLQLLSNAAKEDGVQMNSVARAMNQLTITTQKARDGNEKAINSFAALGVSLDEIRNLSPEQLFLKIADGVKNADDRTAAYAAVATLLGARMGTDLIPTLSKGSDEIRRLGNEMGVMSDSTINNLDKIHRAWAQMQNQLTVGLGSVISALVESWQRAWYAVSIDVIAARDIIISAVEVIKKALTGDFKGAIRELHAGADLARAYGKEIFAQEGFEGVGSKDAHGTASHGPGTAHIGLDASEGNTSPGGTSLRSSASSSSSRSSGSSSESLQERINKLNEESRQRSLTADQKLNELQETRNRLLKAEEAERYDMNGLAGRDERMQQIQLDLAQNRNDIEKASVVVAKENEDTQKKITAEREKAEKQAQKEAEERARALEQAQAETDALAENNQQLRDTVQYGSQIAQQLAQHRRLQGEIDDVTERINQAWSEGNQTLAEQLTEMRDQLKTEQALTAETERRVAAEREALAAQREQARNAETWRRGMQDFANNAAGYTAEELYAISQGRREYLNQIREFSQRLDLVRSGANKGQWRLPTPEEIGAYARQLNPAFYAMEKRLSEQTLDNSAITTAQRILASANQRRSIADEIAYLQNTAIPGVEHLIRPDEQSFQIVKYLQEQLTALNSQLEELKRLTGLIKGSPGTG